MTTPLRKQLALAAALCLAAGAPAQDDSTVRSPFQAPTRKAPAETVAPPNALDAFEFNGFTKLDGKVRVSVYDTKNRRNYWLEEGGAAVDGIVLRRFDPKRKTASIARGTVSKTLELKSAQIVSLKVPQAAPLPAATAAAAAGDPEATGNAVVARNQESDEEVRERMRRMAEEIRRRRALRRQMIEERNAATDAGN